MPNIFGFSHVDLTVSDAERSAAWYQQVLGLEHAYTNESPGTFSGRIISLLHPPTGMILSLVQHQHPEPGTFSEFRVGLDHLSFAVQARDDLEAWVVEFDRTGVGHSGVIDMWYGSALVFRDPDGIQLEFFVAAPAPELAAHGVDDWERDRTS